MMEFQQRLQKAIERGQRAGDARAQELREKELSEKELQRLHTQYRLELCEHIERCMTQLADQFPGFQTESIVGERGWGAAISRDALQLSRSSGRSTQFSRLEIYVRAFSSAHVLELAAKGTINNREVYNRSQYQKLTEADLHLFNETVDNWALDYAEQLASH